MTYYGQLSFNEIKPGENFELIDDSKFNKDYEKEFRKNKLIHTYKENQFQEGVLEDYAYLSNYGVYSAIALFAVAFVAHALDVAFSVRSLEEKTKLDFSRTRRIGNLATVMIVLAFIALFVAVLFRGISAERVPWGNMYEFSITGALAFTGAYLYALWKYRIKWLGLPVSIAVLLTLGTAVTILYVPSAPLVPALKSAWLVIHVSAAIISGGVFLLANCSAGTYLILDRYESRGARPVWALK